MTEKKLGLRALLVGLLLSSGALLWAQQSFSADRLSQPRVSLSTSDDRRDTLNAFKTAWANRPSEPTPDNARAEKDFINRTAYFLDKVHRREVGRDANTFYKEIVRDFFARYHSEDILGQR